MSYKVGMVSLGCSKNQVDGEMLLATVQQAGYTLCNSEEEADAVIVNTCGFIESAKKESIDEILQLARRKEAGKLKAIVVTGGKIPNRNPQRIARSRCGAWNWC